MTLRVFKLKRHLINFEVTDWGFYILSFRFAIKQEAKKEDDEMAGKEILTGGVGYQK